MRKFLPHVYLHPCHSRRGSNILIFLPFLHQLPHRQHQLVGQEYVAVLGVVGKGSQLVGVADLANLHNIRCTNLGIRFCEGEQWQLLTW